jgi:predicted ABC-type ATPase
MAKAFIITAAPGVGKTTLLPLLEPHLPHSTAVLDGDSVGRINPWALTVFWLNLVQDNIIACASVFLKNGLSNFVTAFCLPSTERIERIVNGLSKVGYDPYIIAMFVDNDELKRRHISRGALFPDENDLLQSSVELNETIKKLECHSKFDSSKMSVEIAARELADLMKRIC